MKNMMLQVKNSNRWSAICLTAIAVIAFALSACKNNNEPSEPVVPTEPADPTGKAKYTVIIYANNGENLEVDEERDIADAAGFLMTKKEDLSVRCAVYMKYSSQEGLDKQSQEMVKKAGKPFVAGGKAGEVYFFEVGPDCINFENKEAVQYLSLPDKWIADHSNAAMYDPKYIASVLKDVAKNMPAENYILVLAGHAAGWEPDEDGDYPAPSKAPQSTITDAFNGGRAIKAKELHDGIKQSGIPVCAVVFDCCLQNSIEYLSELTDVTTYTLASGHTTHGGDYGSLLKELFEAPEGQAGLKKALSNYADVYAINHKNDWEDNQNDKVLMNVDFAVAEMAKMPAVWTALKSIVDYMCANVKDSAQYAIPSRQCYHYYNGASKYDLSDYLYKMMKEGAPYANNEAYRALYNNVYYALEGAIVHHAYALHYASDLPDDAEAPKLSVNVNLGAMGRMQDTFEESESGSYTFYDYTGKQWFFYPEGTPTWTEGDETSVAYDWRYSYDLSVFDQKTGWSRWIKLNPVMPYNNPPIGDEGDTND